MSRCEFDWASKRVETARESKPVPEAVADALKQHLSSKLSERPLRPPELSALARELLQAITLPADDSPAS
jgi:hypothetical protein